jgi:Type VI secretion system effector, Hcp
MRFSAWVLRPPRAAALVAAGVAVGAGGAATAVAIADVGSGGAIHACVETCNGAPVSSAGNVRIIDPDAGQSCTAVGAAGPPEEEISWNEVGPQGQAGPQGQTGLQGQAGPQGPAGTPGSPGNVVTLAGETFTISGVKQVGTLENVTPVAAQPATGTSPVATLVLGSGKDAEQVPVTGWSVIEPGGAAKSTKGSIQIQRVVDKASPTLFKFCVTGKHFNSGHITVRKVKGGKTLTMNLTNAIVSAYDESSSGKNTPTETLTLNYTKIEYSYSSQ